MKLITTSTGSFPPLPTTHSSTSENKVTIPASIRNAIQKQIECQIALLVDGQVRADIVGIFARSIGLEGEGLPYHVTQKLNELKTSVTLPDLETAASIANGRPLKAHITGPTVIAESCLVTTQTPPIYQAEAGFHRLTLDLASALSQEALLIASRSTDLNIQYLQIDEPSLVYGANLDLAGEAIAVIANSWRQATGREVILHVCGDTRSILDALLDMPVDILNIENIHLREVDDHTLLHLRQSNKKLALGLIPVNTAKVPTSQRVAREILAASDRYGSEKVWGVTPNCGLRASSPEMAVARIQCLVDAVKIVSGPGNEGRRG